MTFQIKAGGNWVSLADPQVKVGNNWTPATEVWVNDAGTWKQVWVRAEDVRWSSSAVTTYYGTMTEYDSANTKDGSFGDTSTYGYFYADINEYVGSSGIVVYSHATGSASSAIVKVNNKFVGNESGISTNADIYISTNGGSTYGTVLRSRSTNQGSDGSIVTSTSASLGVSNRDQLKIKVSGNYQWYYDDYYEMWGYASAYFEIYDIYVTFS